MQSWCRRAVLAATLGLAACSESPTSPPDGPDADRPDLSIITPVILPAGADWGLYFQSFNQTRSLTARAIHYPDGRVTGSGIFAIPLVGTGILRVTGASPYGNCIPRGSPLRVGHQHSGERCHHWNRPVSQRSPGGSAGSLHPGSAFHVLPGSDQRLRQGHAALLLRLEQLQFLLVFWGVAPRAAVILVRLSELLSSRARS